MDDLRDYRFYAEDMLHPSSLVPLPHTCIVLAVRIPRAYADTRAAC